MPVALGDEDAVRTIDGVTVPFCSTVRGELRPGSGELPLTIAAIDTLAPRHDHG